MNISDYKGVMVFVEQRDGEIQKVSLELLGKGKEIAQQLNENLIAVLLGESIQAQAQELIYYGADQVLFVDNNIFANYTTEPYTKALTAIIEDTRPDIVLMGATAIGRDLAPRVSARVRTGLTADCTSLEVDGDSKLLLMTRPAFGGNVMATIICPDHRPQMSTVRPGVMQQLTKDNTRTGSVEEFALSFSKDDLDVEILEIVKQTKKKVNIEDAHVLVAAGRGIEKQENLRLLEELSQELKGTVAASRAVIDAGWLDKGYQVGQTGKTVRPDLYIASGISGAIQHLAGMEESKYIVAINKNKEAPIFEVADVGIVGDVGQVISALLEELRNRGQVS